MEILSHPTDFSVAHYLNQALQTGTAAPHDETATQARLAELALGLQYQTTACHEEIGKLGAELRAIVPRCAADVGRVTVGLTGLQQDALALNAASHVALWGTPPPPDTSNAGVLSRSSSEPGETTATTTAAAVPPALDSASSSLETLSTLHALQANLARTREILTAAATWDETLATLPGLLAQGAAQLPAAVAQLAKLVRGEQALRGMPNPESRTAALERTRLQVAALLQPQLAHALQSMQARLGPLQQCVQLYAQLEMLDQLQAQYVKHRPAALHKLWFDYQAPTAANPGATPLADWLPTWFQAVLQLLQEERRQAATVFGAAAVPQLLLKILSQALQPIVPSFCNRMSSSAHHDMVQVARVYEACLQFVSLAYELIATVYLDYMEGSTTTTTTSSSGAGGAATATPIDALELWCELEKVVVDILGKVLQTFQTEWAQRERTAALETTLPAARAALSGVLAQQSGLEQASMDALWTWCCRQDEENDAANDANDPDANKLNDTRLTTWMPLALGRFRLLRGGYGAPEAVSVLDNLLAAYIGQVTELLRPFLESCSASSSHHYEDAHVTAALSILKVAGWMQTEYENLQAGTKQEFSVLQGRLEKHIRWLERIPSATDDKSKAAKFVLPDSLSTVEINSMLTLAACGGSGANKVEAAQAALATLERLSNENTLFTKARQAVTDLSQVCHVFCFNVCFAVPRLHLASLSSLDAWNKSATAEDALASYGTLPQGYITHVGEHVLSLVQALEPFAMDAASLAMVQPVMKDLRHVAKQPWKELLHASGMEDDDLVDDKVLERLMVGKDLLDLVVGAPLEEEVEEPEGEGDNEEAKAVTNFCNAWLDVVGLAVTGRLLERLLRIPTLTSKGCEHLQADLNYLVNVLMALGVQGHPHPLLGHVAELAVLDGSILRERIQSHDTREPLENCLAAMERRLAAIKGA